MSTYGRLGQNRPLENISISEEDKAKGYYTVGTATLDKTEEKQFLNRDGYFLTKYETSNETAVPVFKEDNKRGLPTELSIIRIEKN